MIRVRVKRKTRCALTYKASYEQTCFSSAVLDLAHELHGVGVRIGEMDSLCNSGGDDHVRNGCRRILTLLARPGLHNQRENIYSGDNN